MLLPYTYYSQISLLTIQIIKFSVSLSLVDSANVESFVFRTCRYIYHSCEVIFK